MTGARSATTPRGTSTPPTGIVDVSLGGAVLIAAALLSACPTTVGQNDALGDKGIVAFTAETPLVFSTRLVVGSSFTVDFHAVDAKDDAKVAQGVLSSSNEKAIALKDGKFTVVGPGTTVLSLKSKASGTIDTISVHAGKAGATTLVDAAMLNASTSVDARLPSSFAWTTGDQHVLQISAVDVCGGDMLDLHASTVVDSGTTPTTVTAGGPATFVAQTQAAGDAGLTLKTPGLDDLKYTVAAVDTNSIDTVKAAAAAVDDQNNITLWGQAFANGHEVVGDLAFTWIADPRVTLAATQGLVVTANVSVPGPDQVQDTRPATVTVAGFGQTSQPLDLLTLGGTTAVTSYGTPARTLPSASTGGLSSGGAYGGAAGSGCGGNGGCNPEAALIGLVGLRSLRKLKRISGLLARSASC